MTSSSAPQTNWGYPPQRAEALAHARNQALWIIGGLGGSALLSGISAFAWEAATLPAALFGALFLFGLLVGIAGYTETARHARIIPYYRSRVGEVDAFLDGQAAAYHYQALERLAREAGVPPLSSYGFADDLVGEPVTWHPASEGLRTIRALRDVIRRRPEALAGPRGVDLDLQRWEEALIRADSLGIEFALLLLFGNSTSALEWDRRSGSPF